jgi:hypothetical protein
MTAICGRFQKLQVKGWRVMKNVSPQRREERREKDKFFHLPLTPEE